MKRLWLRVLRDLLLLPLTAFLVYQGVALLPVKAEGEQKESLSFLAEQQQRDLGVGQPWGFVTPWKRLWEGERLGSGTRSYNLEDLSRALAGSLRIGALALLLALLLGGGYALFRTLSTRAAAGLELLPTLVYGTPSFILALVVAMGTGVSYDDDKAAFEPFAALVMAVGPGIFLGVILADALRQEAGKPYVVTARMKGWSVPQAVFRHALPNALPALFDALPPVATALLAGSFVAEKLFNVTYFGLLYVDAAKERQLGVIVVATTVFASLLILVSLSAELLKAAFNPRAREGGE